jgi:hypothetical protein
MAAKERSLPVAEPQAAISECHLAVPSMEETRLSEIVDARIAQVADELKRVNRIVRPFPHSV